MSQSNEKRKKKTPNETDFSLAVYLYFAFRFYSASFCSHGTSSCVQFSPFGSNDGVRTCVHIVCVGISRWIFYHFIVSASVCLCERAHISTLAIGDEGASVRLFFGRISRIYDIIFSNHKYFSSKLLYSKFFIMFRLLFCGRRLYVCICSRSLSCQKNYDPLFLCRTSPRTFFVDCENAFTSTFSIELRFISAGLVFCLLNARSYFS